MTAELVWGAIFVAVGAMLVLFNKQWVEWTAPLIRVRLALADRPRLVTVLLGLIFIGGGVSSIVSALGGRL